MGIDIGAKVSPESGVEGNGEKSKNKPGNAWHHVQRFVLSEDGEHC